LKERVQDKVEIITNFTLKKDPLFSNLNGEVRSCETSISM